MNPPRGDAELDAIGRAGTVREIVLTHREPGTARGMVPTHRKPGTVGGMVPTQQKGSA